MANYQNISKISKLCIEFMSYIFLYTVLDHSPQEDVLYGIREFDDIVEEFTEDEMVLLEEEIALEFCNENLLDNGVDFFKYKLNFLYEEYKMEHRKLYEVISKALD